VELFFIIALPLPSLSMDSLVKDPFPNGCFILGTSATLLAMVTAGSRAVIAESLQVIGCIAFWPIIAHRSLEDCTSVFAFLYPSLDPILANRFI
jgi:hypothetical protein